jgi:hypothetical protein
MTELIAMVQQYFGPGLSTIIIVCGLMFGSRMIKPGLATADATTKIIEELKGEAGKWQDLYDETHKLLDETKKQNGLLEKQLHEAENHTDLLRRPA